MTISHTPKFGRKQTTTLLPDGIVQVTERKLGVEHVYQVSTAQLSPQYTVYRDAKVESVIAAIGLFIGGGLAFYFRFPHSPTDNGWEFMLMSGILWGMGVLAYCHRMFGRVDVVIFMDRERRRALLSIPRQSSPDQFAIFIQKLVAQIPPVTQGQQA